MNYTIMLEELTLEQLQILYDRVPQMRSSTVSAFLRWANGEAPWYRSAAEAWLERKYYA